MANITNEVIICGQRIPLGGGIPVINFLDNPEYSFINPVGGSCVAEQTGAAPGLNIPGVVATPTEPNTSTRRRHTWRRGMSDRAIAAMDNLERINALKGVLRQVIIHHDATYTSHDCFTVLCRRGLSTHFMCNHDGGIIQGMDPMYVSYHAGEFNGQSIGVDMNNVATVEGHQTSRQDLAFGGAVDYSIREVITGRINRSRARQSFAYTEPQYVAIAALLRMFHELLGIPLIYPQDENGEVLGTRLTNPSGFLGFYGHQHCQAGKWDPGPGFNWSYLMELLYGETNHWPVELEGVDILRDVRSQEAADSSTRVFYENTEVSGAAGGTYPMGLNQQWHDGVHIYVDEGTPVKAVAAGDIILCRNGPTFPVGSPNFVLIRHRLEREILNLEDPTNPVIEEDVVTWYSLYMHMQRMDHSLVPRRSTTEDEPEDTDDDDGDDDDNGETGENTDIAERILPTWFQRLVQIAREHRGGELNPRGDYSIFDVRSDPDRFYSLARNLLRVQDFSFAFQCVEDGNPFRWISDGLDLEQEGVPVNGGEIIGYSGHWGELRPDADPIRHACFQFQVFSTSPIFDDTRFDADTWQRVQADHSRNNLISVRDIVLSINSPVTQDPDLDFLDLGRGRLLTPSDIANFFRGGDVNGRARMRRMITQHLSEWDIGNAETMTSDIRILWPWQSNQEYQTWLAHHIGFKWLTDDTRPLLGMVEGPQEIYTYHPIYLLGWWALNYGRSVQGQTFEGLSDEELAAAIEAEACPPIEELSVEDDPDLYSLCVEGGDPQANLIPLDDLERFTLDYNQFLLEDNGEWPNHFNLIDDPFGNR